MSVVDASNEDRLWQDHLQSLHRRFYEEADDRCLLWINPAQGDPFAESSLVDERRVRVPIHHPNFDIQLAPYLVPLNLGTSRDADVFRQSVAAAWNAWEFKSLVALRGQPIGGWVLGNASPHSLAQHWAKNCHIHPLNGMYKLLRFHDPSAREWLWSMFTPMQRVQLLGPASSIVAFNRQQQFMTHDLTAIPPDTPGRASTLASERVSSLQLSRAQWDEVNDYATVHLAWLRYRSLKEDSQYPIKFEQRWEKRIFEALRNATIYGIVDAQDRELFAFHAIQIGDEFHADEKLKGVWEMTRMGEYYGGVLEEKTGVSVYNLQNFLHAR